MKVWFYSLWAGMGFRLEVLGGGHGQHVFVAYVGGRVGTGDLCRFFFVRCVIAVYIVWNPEKKTKDFVSLYHEKRFVG